MICLSFAYAQETIFLETCGSIAVSTSKKVDLYTGWDNSAPVTFTRTSSLDGCADVRSTSTITNHIWFPADKSSDLIISHIAAVNFKNLKLSFDIAAYKLTGSNINKLTLYCNGNVLSLPSDTLTSSKFVPVSDIALPNSDNIELKFEYTAANNTNGYRIDNIKIIGEKATLDITNPSTNNFKPYISGEYLVIPDHQDGIAIEIYNSSGCMVQHSILKNSSIVLRSKITKGLYLIRAAKTTWKIIF